MESVYLASRRKSQRGDGLGKILSSSKTYARSQFILKGLTLTTGSVEETLAIRALKHKNLTEYVKTLTIVQAISYAASVIANCAAGEDPGSPESVNDMLGHLKVLLMPDTVDEKENKAQKVKDVMERELSQGPFKVESMVYEKRGKGLN